MDTGGHGNDALMILVPVGVSIVIGVILFGGPAETLEAANDFVREVVYYATEFVSALL
jgi:hypothetical protein